MKTRLFFVALLIFASCKQEEGALLNAPSDTRTSGPASGHSAPPSGHADYHVDGVAEAPARSGGMGTTLKNFWNQASGLFKWDQLRSYVANLGLAGDYCAMGVRKALDVLLGRPEGTGEGTAAACLYNSNVLNSKFKKPGFAWIEVNDRPRSLAPGDVVVCQVQGGCGKSKTTAGHIELYSPSGWSSDFRQQGSICFTNPRYTGARQYRMVKDGQASKAVRTIEQYSSSWITSSAWAGNLSALQEQSNRVVSTKIYSDSYAEYTLLESKLSGGDSNTFIYTITRNIEAKNTVIKKSNMSAFHALRGIGNMEAARALAVKYVKHWVNELGRAKAQQNVSEAVFLDSLQKEAYIDNGLTLPIDFRIMD